ncbi:MAG: hypothetical protein JO262_09745 [Solirubrobacterales bacterium]|nr:hypothetical protein [Solirubrobacterales bacterium]MBV9942398.1 hypothetical protein [Solirubrobacterales bacterium]
MALIRLIALVLLTAAVATGCGGAGSTSSTPTTGSTPTSAGNRTAVVPPFAWLHPGPAPPGWSQARLPGSVVLSYPSSWRRIHSDPGTVSAARTEPGSGRIADYLNVTPQQGGETLGNWARFRPAHNVEEGDSHVQLLAAARGLHFQDGRGSCVIDRYRTPATTYQEIACLVRGPRSASVVVAAGLAARWARDAPALERAVSAFSA